MLARNKGCLACSYLKAIPAITGRFISSNSNTTILMKVLATLALVIGLTSCGTCPLSPKKDCCKSGTSCDSKKTTDCKTCKH